MRTTRWLALGIAAVAAVPAGAQSVSAKPRGSTTAPSNTYSVGYGSRQKVNQLYEQAYFTGRQEPGAGYVVNPYLFMSAAPTRPVTAARPYSAVQHGNILEQLLSSLPVASSAGDKARQSVLEKATTGEDNSGPTVVEATVLDVQDRGELVVDTQEEIRLRGVRMYTERTGTDRNRMLGREAARRLRELTQNSKVYLVLDEPQRSSDGPLLATVYLPDGTELNRLLLAEGLGRLNEKDFLPEVRLDDWRAAEALARGQKIGVWSTGER